MQKKKWVGLFLVPLCLLIWSCGDNDSSHHSLPMLDPATPGSLAVCSELTNTTQFSFVSNAGIETVIDSAEIVPAGGVIYDDDETYPAPEHCLVKGHMNDRTGISGSPGAVGSDSHYAIGFEMRLPTAWNGRFYYQANGGLDGSVSAAVGRFMFSNGPGHAALGKGFAVISSDAGHQPGAPFFGIDPQARLDYGYNAVAELTPMAKALIKTAYGKQPDRSYFGGCSNGGRHTMVAAARYADMYDGFLVGNPGFHLPQAAISQLYSAQQYATIPGVTLDAGNNITGAFTDVELALVASKVVGQCDALDGASDGMINNTIACQAAFDLDRDVDTCVVDDNSGRNGSCLTTAQKAALGHIMSGPRNNEGEAIYASFPYDAGMAADNWAYWEFYASANLDPGAVGYIFTTPPTPFIGSMSGYEYALAFDMDTDAPKIYATDDTYTVSSMDFMTPPNETDLSILKNRGAKMMVFHGTGDSVFSPNDTMNWYQGLEAANSGDATNFSRLFLVPGMNHCGAGPATDEFDGLDALIDWVEEGVEPDSVMASVRADNPELPNAWATDRTRPLCPYPQIAKYIGTGSIEDAASFVCEEP